MNSTDFPNGNVTLTKNDGIGTIEFFHPASNSLPGVILKLLADTIAEAGNDNEIHVIVIKSSGDRAFCAGASFDELMSINNEEVGKEFFMGFARVINAMRKAPKFVIGRVQGKTVGGGVGLASSVDYCFATKFASVKLSELAIGIGPFVVGPAVQRKLGISVMSQLAVDASSWRTADWAESHGLFAQVFESTEEMDGHVEGLAQKLAKSNPEAMEALKNNFWSGTEHWDELLEERAAMSGKLVLSEFTRNAISAFKAGQR
ncbi:enoyl-CoA hydratase/isomerase family protein [Cryomorphaceae bacterium 1068]|nr:enoyl-CoA hydratase/isomerase family protein [Cryomorphaceae bacterium 1068]